MPLVPNGATQALAFAGSVVCIIPNRAGTYRHEWESLAGEDESGNPVTEVQKEDLSAYSIASDIIDKRDGRIIAVMGRPTEKEELQAALAAAEAAMTEGVNSIVDDE